MSADARSANSPRNHCREARTQDGYFNTPSEIGAGRVVPSAALLSLLQQIARPIKTFRTVK
jgi:hypothetical protein